MSRLSHVDPARAEGEAKTLYARIERQLGGVPNFMQVLANSPPTLAAFLGLSGNLSRGALDPQLRERLALEAAEVNDLISAVIMQVCVYRRVRTHVQRMCV